MKLDNEIVSKIRTINNKYDTSINYLMGPSGISIVFSCDFSILAVNNAHYLLSEFNLTLSLGRQIYINSKHYEQALKYLSLLEKEIEKFYKIRLFL